ncbi:MAG: hypothetical protein J6X46_01405 [Prevotella sp.]|nr:hypothetical protein [Prevotella sp.]
MLYGLKSEAGANTLVAQRSGQTMFVGGVVGLAAHVGNHGHGLSAVGTGYLAQGRNGLCP